MNYLYDQSLLSLKQRKHKPLRLDADGTDRDAFNKLKSIEDNIEKFVNTGTNLYIHSPISGNGKTEWSLRLLQSYIGKIWFKSDLRCRVLFINVPRYLISLKESITTPSDYVDHIKKNIFDADIVVFDELGIKAATTFEFENLLNFINTRIDLGKSNIYTSNLTASELNDRLGSRLYSRILNMSVDVEFRGADKRGL
jgi:DNA replication protein DnaC